MAGVGSSPLSMEVVVTEAATTVLVFFIGFVLGVLWSDYGN